MTSSDIVHIFGLRDPVGLLAASTATRRGIPYLVEPSGMHRIRLRSPRLKRAYDFLLGDSLVQNATLVVATSELEARELIGDGLEPQSIRVRPNGVMEPPGDRDAPNIRARYGIPAKAPLVLALGRIAAKKGLADVATVTLELNDTYCLIAGPDDRDGTYEELMKIQRSHVTGDRLIIEPEGLWGNDKWKALTQADCFYLVSQTENFGVAAAEAAVAGVPVLISDMCGVAEFLEPDVMRVVRPGDRIGLRSALADVLGPPVATRARSLSAAARVRFDWSRIAEQQVAIYEEVVAGTTAG